MTIALFSETHDKKCGHVCVDGGGKLILDYDAKNGNDSFLGQCINTRLYDLFCKSGSAGWQQGIPE